MNDLRFAFRQLLKNPGFTAVAVITLALGIGANTAIFSVVWDVLLRPLPYPEQERLVSLSEWSEQAPNGPISYSDFLDWRARQTSFTAIGIARRESFTCVAAGETERVSGAMASHDLFAALGVQPLHGRLFAADDDKPGADRTVVIREGFWKRRFGGRDSTVGETIQLDGNPYTIVGVLPEAFQYPTRDATLWVPIGIFADSYQSRLHHPDLYATGKGNQNAYHVEGEPEAERGRHPMAVRFRVNYDYFATMGIPLLAGRLFNAQDQANSQPVAMVDTQFVRKHFAGKDPIGQRFAYGIGTPRNQADWLRTVGVVEHVQSRGLGQAAPVQTYVPYAQSLPTFVTFAARTDRDPAALGLTRFLRGLLYEVSALDGLTFAAAALVLTSISVLACYLPARRATKVDPMTALRTE